ncbi:hypothetical protein PV328_009588 [Microctonus aethiopoides]|uniref:A-kinase anchor protein 2 C-terminal domain-containing protein n=1 Tax=Microctonus aethiopoides TaxID=144406 RepID=A0AA39EZC5_9HYME|nr:hypothetical protein PV328_009588 [Microctonus aethiopoides]
MKMEANNREEQLKKATDRIQREIEEVTEREHELRSVGSIRTTSDETVDSKVRRMSPALLSGKLRRTTSTPHILESSITLTPITQNLIPKMTNGVISSRTTPTPLRFATNPSQKGLMHRFLATRGKIFNGTRSPNSDDFLTPPPTPTIVLNPLSVKALSRSLSVQVQHDDEPKKLPVRKGYVPVEEKIQKELNEMKERENELRLMRSRMLAKSQPNLLDIENDNDSDIYDGTNSLRSGTSSNTLNDDESDRELRGKHILKPRRRSTLIAQWENFISEKKKSTENNDENENHF